MSHSSVQKAVVPDSAPVEPRSVESRPRLQLLWGAEAIGAELGITARRAYHMLERNQIPARKVSGRWVAERTVLGDFFRREPSH